MQYYGEDYLLVECYNFVLLYEHNRVFMQAESAVDQMDWIEKITGVIASLLTSQSPEQVSNW
jgi:hypothetical protein